jgi:hypothetical protein
MEAPRIVQAQEHETEDFYTPTSRMWFLEVVEFAQNPFLIGIISTV